MFTYICAQAGVLTTAEIRSIILKNYIAYGAEDYGESRKDKKQA